MATLAPLQRLPSPPRPSAQLGAARTTSVVVADEQPLARAGLRALLDGEPDIAVLADVATGREALAAAAELRPDVLITDVTLPHPDGVEVARRLAEQPALARVRVLVLTSCQNEERMLDALRAGASGFLLRDARPRELARAVRTVAAGGGVLAPSVTRRLLAEFARYPVSRRPRPEQLEELTPREVEVVGLVASGMTNTEIADHLVVSPATAKTHVSRAMCKLGARDRAQLVTLAYESGLVTPRRAPVGVAA